MKKIILLISLTLFFTACSVTSLDLDKNDRLMLKNDKSTFLLTQKMNKDKFLNFKDLFVQQYHQIDASNNKIFYEYVETSLDYELNFDDLYTLMYVFDSHKYEEVYIDENLQFYQLNLKSKSYINVIVYSNDTQYISYAYGFSNEDFIKIIKSLKPKDKKISKLKFDALVFDAKAKPLSKWSDVLVYFTPLIVPARYKGVF